MPTCRGRQVQNPVIRIGFSGSANDFLDMTSARKRAAIEKNERHCVGNALRCHQDDRHAEVILFGGVGDGSGGNSAARTLSLLNTIPPSRPARASESAVFPVPGRPAMTTNRVCGLGALTVLPVDHAQSNRVTLKSLSRASRASCQNGQLYIWGVPPGGAPRVPPSPHPKQSTYSTILRKFLQTKNS